MAELQVGDRVRYRKSKGVMWEVTYVSLPSYSDARIGVTLERPGKARPRFDVDADLLERVELPCTCRKVQLPGEPDYYDSDGCLTHEEGQ